MVDLRDDIALGDLLLLISISKKVYEAKLILSTYLKITGAEVQYCIGREFLLLAPLEYKRGSNCHDFGRFFILHFCEDIVNSYLLTSKYISKLLCKAVLINQTYFVLESL